MHLNAELTSSMESSNQVQTFLLTLICLCKPHNVGVIVCPWNDLSRLKRARRRIGPFRLVSRTASFSFQETVLGLHNFPELVLFTQPEICEISSIPVGK